MNESIREISKAWREDADFRAEVEADPKAALASRGLEIDSPAEVRVAADTEDTVHFVFPPDPNVALPDGAFDGIAGGVLTTSVQDWTAYESAGGRYDTSR